MSGPARTASLELQFRIPFRRFRRAQARPLHAGLDPFRAPLRVGDSPVVVIDAKLKAAARANLERRAGLSCGEGLRNLLQPHPGARGATTPDQQRGQEALLRLLRETQIPSAGSMMFCQVPRPTHTRRTKCVQLFRRKGQAYFAITISNSGRAVFFCSNSLHHPLISVSLKILPITRRSRPLRFGFSKSARQRMASSL